ncbi:hypothetical protein HMPREF9120_01563 [Neisseria sp. oral taxon 020 str. F0370]|nr:hypothetical protein HMPREF9120_01563 [Neisseria sp. oral taxon 020 str. F0370]
MMGFVFDCLRQKSDVEVMIFSEKMPFSERGMKKSKRNASFVLWDILPLCMVFSAACFKNMAYGHKKAV